MNRLRISRSIILLITYLVSIQVLWAQDAGHLKGCVSDSEGVAIAGTRIIVKSRTTQFETATKESGEFDIELPAGMYRIETKKMPGFIPFKRSRVRIRADQDTVQNIRLKVTSDDAICVLIITAPANKAKPAVKNNRNQ